ncbi:MAG TPA: glycosyltransferase, partial [Pyrinomonadaceae bacterium]|nr:glycosyltransferase [Pyrinomonadaceae bacterium]
MESFISALLVICAVFVAVPVAIFFIEVTAAIASSRRGSSVGMSRDPNHNVAVLVPAHNESAGLLPTITDIKRQLFAGDRLLVVADNCTDDTAAIAAARGAEVIERNDPSRRGKGYALDFGVRHLCQD